MRKFLARLIVFIIIPIVYWTLVASINHFFYTYDPVVLAKHNVLIIGDSHTQKSLDPLLFESAENISQASEPLCISYWKLVKILENNSPKTLIVGFAPQNIAAFNDYKFYDSQWCAEMFTRVYPIQKFDGLDKSIKLNYKTYYKILLKKTAFYPYQEHRTYIGSFSNQNTEFINTTNKTIERHYYLDGLELGVSTVNIHYLDSIILLCQKNNIRPVLVSSPVHIEYYQKIPKIVLEKYEDLKLKYQTNSILVIDKTKEFYPDSLMLDADHLNLKGSQVFTKEVMDLLCH